MSTRCNRLTMAAVGMALAMGLCSCASPVERRIARNPEMYNALSAPDKALVNRGEIREGMSKDGVYLSWGKPARIVEGRRKGQALERWNYVAYDAVWTQEYGFGGFWGRGVACDYYEPYHYYSPTVNYVPYEAGFVEFTGNKVTGWAVPKR